MSDNGWESVRRDRLVKNELAFRDHNNRRAGVEEQAGDEVEDELVPFVCECGSADCISPVMVTVAELTKQPTQRLTGSSSRLVTSIPRSSTPRSSTRTTGW